MGVGPIRPGNPAYNISLLLRLKGQLHISALQQSLLEIQKRHEILRVNFTTVDGKPVQFLVPDRTLPLNIVDLTTETNSSPMKQAEQLADWRIPSVRSIYLGMYWRVPTCSIWERMTISSSLSFIILCSMAGPQPLLSGTDGSLQSAPEPTESRRAVAPHSIH